MPGYGGIPLSVTVKFMHSTGAFHSGEFVSLDLDKISQLRITRQRNTCELLAITPENPQPNQPYSIARRDRENQLEAILQDLRELRTEKRAITYEITDTGISRINTG